MGRAIDDLREALPGAYVPDIALVARVSEAAVARAIDEYDAAAAVAGRLMAEVEELRNLVADTAAACAVWRKRAEAAEAETLALRLKVARLESPRATEAEAKAQQARSLAGATHKPHPEDEADIIEAVRQAKAGEGVSYLTWEETEALFGIREEP